MRERLTMKMDEYPNGSEGGEGENTLISICKSDSELSEENATLRRKIQALETELSESEETISILQSEVWELQKELTKIRS